VRARGAALVLAAALGAAACGEVPPPMPPIAAPSTAWRDLGRHLPRDVLLFVVADSTARVLDGIGRDAIVRAFRAEAERLVFELVREVGHDLTDVETLARIGIDVHAPVGFAVLHPREGGSPTAALVLPLARPSTFKAELYRASARENERPFVVGDGVLVGGGEVSFVLRDRAAVVLMGTDTRDEAVRIAVQEPELSLAAVARVDEAIARVPAEAAVRGFVDGRALGLAALGIDGRWGGRTRAESAAALERASGALLGEARKAGARIETIVALNDELDAARRHIAEEPEATFERALLGSIRSVGIGLGLHPDEVGLDLSVALEADALLAGLFGAPSSADPGGPDAAARLTLGFDPAVAGRIAELAGQDPAPLRAFTGQVQAFAFGGVDQPPGLVVRAGVGDEAVAKKLLDALVARADERKLAARVEGARATVALGAPPAVPELAPVAGVRFDARVGRLALLWLFVEGRSGGVLEPYRDPAIARSPEYEAKAAELKKLGEDIAAAEARRRQGQWRAVAPALDRLGDLTVRVEQATYGVHAAARWRIQGPSIAEVLAEVMKQARLEDRTPPDAELERLYERRWDLGRELIEIHRREAAGQGGQ
jgi:hypothetical protein